MVLYDLDFSCSVQARAISGVPTPTPKGWYYYNTGSNPVHNRCGHYLLPPNPEGVTDQTSNDSVKFWRVQAPAMMRGPEP